MSGICGIVSIGGGKVEEKVILAMASSMQSVPGEKIFAHAESQAGIGACVHPEGGVFVDVKDIIIAIDGEIH
ncbi:MAG: hypothetical protein NC933_01985, partial [Candidatus Omnitrophica bacterium]|nr:hypothetical protein [Candidatus Omnitrophota bacterium]